MLRTDSAPSSALPLPPRSCGRHYLYHASAWNGGGGGQRHPAAPTLRLRIPGDLPYAVRDAAYALRPDSGCHDGSSNRHPGDPGLFLSFSALYVVPDEQPRGFSAPEYQQSNALPAFVPSLLFSWALESPAAYRQEALLRSAMQTSASLSVEACLSGLIQLVSFLEYWNRRRHQREHNHRGSSPDQILASRQFPQLIPLTDA